MKTLTLVFCAALLTSASYAQNWAMQKTGDDPAMAILCDGELITKYHYQDVPRPFFYPLIGPHGEELTRGYPMNPKDDEQTDHLHHRSLWFGHGDVNGVDFWHETPPGKKETRPHGKIHHAAFNGMKAGSGPMEIRCRNEWIANSGEKLCEDARVYRFTKTEDGHIAIDFDITLKATNGDIEFGDTKEGTMALRVLPQMRLEGEHAKGGILNSEGVSGKAAWGKRAAWCDFFGPDRSGNMVGIAIFNHPENAGHPTHWHARHYGLFAANPFGKRSFLGKDAEEGGVTIKNGEEFRLRYRILLHKEKPEDAGVDKAYRAYVSE
ncbi:MAG: PmoA family protein [Verrucomicrobiota bacterium]